MHNHDEHQHTHTHKNVANNPDELAMCPVMRIPVNKEEAKAHGLTRTYKAETYYFCCNHCKQYFENNPERCIREKEENQS